MSDTIDNASVIEEVETILPGDIVLVEVEDGIMTEDGKRYDIGIKGDESGYFQVYFTNNFDPYKYIDAKENYIKMTKISEGDMAKHFKNLANAYYKLKKEDLDKNYKEFTRNSISRIENLKKDI